MPESSCLIDISTKKEHNGLAYKYKQKIQFSKKLI